MDIISSPLSSLSSLLSISLLSLRFSLSLSPRQTKGNYSEGFGEEDHKKKWLNKE